MLDSQNLEDIHNRLNQGKIKYTFTSSNYGTRNRIDKIIMEKYLIKNVMEYKLATNVISDHEGINLNLKWGTRNKWGRGNWSMNTSILEDPGFKNTIKDVIEVYKVIKTERRI